MLANNHPILHFGGLTQVGFRCLTVEPTHRVPDPDPQTTVGGNLGPGPRSSIQARQQQQGEGGGPGMADTQSMQLQSKRGFKVKILTGSNLPSCHKCPFPSPFLFFSLLLHAWISLLTFFLLLHCTVVQSWPQLQLRVWLVTVRAKAHLPASSGRLNSAPICLCVTSLVLLEIKFVTFWVLHIA